MDSYTVKKILPRLLIAVIAVQLSYFIVGFLVDIFNILGNGVAQIILSPIGGEINFSLNFGKAGDVAAVGGLAALVLNIPAILSALVPLVFVALLAVLAVLFTLVFRQVIIATLILLAPIAFVAWILPNTERFFKMWADYLIKALMMYPLITALLASGVLMSSAVEGLIPDPGEGESALKSIVQIVVVIAPYLLIPFTFKFAGSAIAGIANLSDTFGKRVGGARKGPDGKPGTGLAGKTQGLMDRQRAGIAQGTSLLGKGKYNPTRYLAGAGILPRTASARSVADFNSRRIAAGKDLEGRGISSKDALNEFAAHGGSKLALGRRLRQLQSTSGKTAQQIEQDATTARDLSTMSDLAGKKEYQAASLQRAAEFGGADQRGFSGVARALAGNSALAASAVGDAAFAGKGKDATYMGYGVDSSGNLNFDPNAVSSMITKLSPEDLAGQKDLSKVHDHVVRAALDADKASKNVAGIPDPIEREKHGKLRDSLVGTLRSMGDPRSAASAQNRAEASQIISELSVQGIALPPETMGVNVEQVGGQDVPHGPGGPTVPTS